MKSERTRLKKYGCFLLFGSSPWRTLWRKVQVASNRPTTGTPNNQQWCMLPSDRGNYSEQFDVCREGASLSEASLPRRPRPETVRTVPVVGSPRMGDPRPRLLQSAGRKEWLLKMEMTQCVNPGKSDRHANPVTPQGVRSPGKTV